jgi:hypothetical protein
LPSTRAAPTGCGSARSFITTASTCAAQINRVPRGLAQQWDKRRLANETVKLLAARGAEIRAQLITHVVP